MNVVKFFEISSQSKAMWVVSTKNSRSANSTGYLHINSRNHSNTLLFINLQEPKTCSKLTTAGKAIYSDISILTV